MLHIAHVLFAPLAILRLRRKAVTALVLYFTAGAILLGVLASVLIANEAQLRRLLLSYVLPETWLSTGDLLLTTFFDRQAKVVLVNAVVSGTLVLLAIVLFPIKERASLAFERQAALTSSPIDELPLWQQGTEEAKLLLIFITAQMTIFWIGYAPDPTRKQLASLLSFVFLYFSYSVDFISPLLQRHRLRYSRIIHTLMRKPLVTLGFGAIFSAPPVIGGLYAAQNPDLSLSTQVYLTLGINLLAIGWAVIGGTWMGAKVLPAAQSLAPVRSWVRIFCWVILIGTFCANSYVFGSVARSMHHKSQILKCEYDLVPGTWSFDRLRLGQITSGRVGLEFDLRIHNPTSFDVDIENSRLEVRHGAILVAKTRLSPLAVEAGATRVETVDLDIELHSDLLTQWRSLLKDRWTLTLFVRVADRFDFPIYLRTAP